jgi:ferrous iron transport protein B
VDQGDISGRPVLLVGNPNVGKSVVFGYLTGRYVEVSNYPGTTVEVTRGRMKLAGDDVAVIDTPGINSLTAQSMDEQVTRDILSAEVPRAVVQIADTKNLRRALLLTGELAQRNLPLVMVLNMQDEAAARGVKVDTQALAERLGIEVLPAVAVSGEGLERLPEAIRAARRAQPIFSEDSRNSMTATNQGRFQSVDRLLQEVYRKNPPKQSTLSERLSLIAIHPVWGWPLLALVLMAMYQVVGVLGAGELVNLLEEVAFGEWINPLAQQMVGALGIPLITDFLVGEYGLVTMALTYGIAIVLPIVTTFFIMFSILEDSGYLPRLAVMVNRPFKALGLNGKAVLPMVLGLGCDTMATMTCRILETRRERILTTLLLALGVPCSAQLGVILGMVSLVSPVAMLTWGGVVLFVMLAVGWIAARLMPGESSDFIVELPPIRLPRIDNILFKTLARLEWYLKEVLPLFIVGTAVLFVLDRTGGLKLIEQAASPLVEGFLGLPREATAAFLIGFLRRDYGAAGLFAMAREGLLNPTQVTISLVVIMLFIPCVANFLMILKEYGWKTTAWVTGVVVPLAFAVGGALNALMSALRLSF